MDSTADKNDSENETSNDIVNDHQNDKSHDHQHLNRKKTVHQYAMYSDIVENPWLPIVVVDDDGNYMYVNEAAVDLFGFSSIEFEHMNIRDIKIIDGQKTRVYLKNFTKTGVDVGEFQFYDKKGEKKTAYYRAYRVKKDFNVFITIDITNLD